jgi:uncharacterized protein (UPF0261 family)
MTAAGRAGVPQMVAPGCYDLLDLVGWQPRPAQFAAHAAHAHNRLISSVVLNADERRALARVICEKLAAAKGAVTLFLPLEGCNEWDRDGAPLADAGGLAAFMDEMRAHCPAHVALREVAGHINDAVFTDTVLAQFDAWMADGTVSRSGGQRRQFDP